MSEVLRLRDELEWRIVEGEVLALDVSGQRYLSANRAGGVLWPALAEGATREELVDRLVETFEIDRGAASRDVDGFLGSLAREGLLADGA